MSFEGTVCVIPSISIANIPQLAVDVLLHSLDFEKKATLSDKYLYPFVAPVDHVAGEPLVGGVSTGLEAYVSPKHKITVLQQRSPVLPGYATDHVTEVLVPFVVGGGFSRVVLLNLLDAGLFAEAPQTMKVVTHEELLGQQLSATLSLSTPVHQEAGFGSVLATETVRALTKVATLLVLVTYAYEGDNFYDAQVMAGKLCSMLGVQIGLYRTPVSWAGVYGGRPTPVALEDGIYG